MQPDNDNLPRADRARVLPILGRVGPDGRIRPRPEGAGPPRPRAPDGPGAR